MPAVPAVPTAGMDLTLLEKDLLVALVANQKFKMYCNSMLNAASHVLPCAAVQSEAVQRRHLLA